MRDILQALRILFVASLFTFSTIFVACTNNEENEEPYDELSLELEDEDGISGVLDDDHKHDDDDEDDEPLNEETPAKPLPAAENEEVTAETAEEAPATLDVPPAPEEIVVDSDGGVRLPKVNEDAHGQVYLGSEGNEKSFKEVVIASGDAAPDFVNRAFKDHDQFNKRVKEYIERQKQLIKDGKKPEENEILHSLSGLVFNVIAQDPFEIEITGLFSNREVVRTWKGLQGDTVAPKRTGFDFRFKGQAERAIEKYEGTFKVKSFCYGSNCEFITAHFEKEMENGEIQELLVVANNPATTKGQSGASNIAAIDVSTALFATYTVIPMIERAIEAKEETDLKSKSEFQLQLKKETKIDFSCNFEDNQLCAIALREYIPLIETLKLYRIHQIVIGPESYTIGNVLAKIGLHDQISISDITTPAPITLTIPAKLSTDKILSALQSSIPVLDSEADRKWLADRRAVEEMRDRASKALGLKILETNHLPMKDLIEVYKRLEAVGEYSLKLKESDFPEELRKRITIATHQQANVSPFMENFPIKNKNTGQIEYRISAKIKKPNGEIIDGLTYYKLIKMQLEEIEKFEKSLED